METDNFRLLVQQHCYMLGAACHPLRPWYRSQAFCVVVLLQMPSHRIAGFHGVEGLRPEGIIDVETAGRQLAKASDVALRLFRRQTPHPDAAKATRIADCSGERRRRDDP